MGALSLAEAVVEVLADTSKLKPSLEAGAKKAFTSYEKAAANAGKVAGGDLSWATGRAALAGAGKPFTDFATGASKIAGKALVGGFAVAGTAAAAGIGVALTKGMGRLTAIDNAQAKLRGLGHDTQAVEGIMKNALGAVKGTAYGLDEAATLSASLVASGIAPGKELEGTLRLVADAATVAGTDMSQMGNIFGKVAASGRLQGDEMNQLMEAGIPILQLLTEHYGKNANEVRKMVSEGKVEFDDFAAAMKNQVGGAALESGKTFSGAMANLKASMGRIGANILQPIFEQLAPLVSEVTGAFGGIEEAAKGFGTIIGPIFTTGVQLIKDFVADMSGAGGSFDWMGTVKSVAEGLSTVFEGFMNVLRVMVPVMGGMLAVGLKIVDWVLKLLGPVLQSERAMRILTTVFLGFAAVGVIIGVVNAIRGAITGMTLAMKGAELAEKSGKATTLAYNAMMSAKTVVTNIATAAQWLWNAAMAAGLLPIIAIVAGIALLVGGFILAYKKSETFRKIVTAAIDGVKKVALAVFDWFRGPFVSFWTTTLPNAFQAGLAWVQEKWAAITGFVTGPIQAVVGWFTGTFVPFFTVTIPAAFQVVVSWVQEKWAAITGLLVGAFTAARDFISAAVGVIVSVIQAIAAPFIAVGTVIGNIYQGYIAPVFQLFAAIVVWLVTKYIQAYIGLIRTAWQAMGALLQSVWSNVIKPTINAVAAIFTWLWNNVVKPTVAGIQAGFRAMGDALRWVWANLIQPAIRAVGNIFTWLWNNVVKPTVSGIKTGFRAMGDGIRWVWVNIIQGTIKGLAAQGQWLWNVVLKPTFTAIRAGFRAVGDGILWVWNNIIKATFNNFRNTAVWIWNTILSPIFTKIKAGWKALSDGMQSLYKTGIKLVFDWFSSAGTKMKSGFDTVITGIGKAWNDLKALALKPIQFVIDTVINKGLIKGFNSLARFFGTKEIKWLPVPKLAKGGIAYPNRYTPGRDIGLAAVSGGEPIMRPEFGRAVGSGWVDTANRVARTRGVSGVRRFMGMFADGGTVQPVPGKGNRHTSGYSWATWAGDFPNPTGTPIKAWKDGIVAAVKHLTTSYGEHVRINHTDGTSSLYAHQSRIIAQLGQKLTAGTIIGLVGSTGNSTGPHLHFETMGGPYNGDGGDPGVFALIDKFKGAITAPLQSLSSKFGENPFVKAIAAAPRKVMTAAVDWLTKKASQLFDKATGFITGASAWVGAKIGAYSKDQLNNAATIISVARQLGFGDRGAQIALMTAMQESTLRNLSGGDRDSVGLFQQRAPWGSFGDRTNPAKSASMFFLGGQGGQRGLRAFNWRGMGLGQAAQAVQVSAFPSAYDKWADEAASLLAKFKGGLAAGTRNAVRGLHLVGENGPELRWFNGGEGVLPAGITRALTSGLAGGTGAGADLVAGFVRGLLSSSRQAAEAARQVAVAAVTAIKAELGIASPSKTLAQIGIWMNQGLAKGLVGSTSTVTSTIKTLTSKVTAAFQAQGQLVKNAMVDRYADQVARLKPLATAAAAAQTKLAATQKKLADAQKKQVSQAQISQMEQQAAAKSSASAQVIKLSDQLTTLRRQLRDVGTGSASAQVIKLSDQLTTLRRQLRDVGTTKKDQQKRTALQAQIDSVSDSLAKARRNATGANQKTRSSLQAQIDSVSDALAKARRNATGASSLLTKIEQAKKSRATVQELQSQVTSLRKLAQGNNKYATQLAQAQKKLAAAKKLDPGTAAVAAGQALMKQYATLTAKINTNAAARAAAATAIKNAQEDLADAVKVRDDYKQAIHDQVAQAADLGSLSSATESWQITETLQARLDSWRTFAKQLATLKGLGISNTAYQQILESGPSSGVAQALISGGKAAVAQVNFLQSEIDRVGTSLGTNASKTLYQAGVDSAKGLLNGLKAQESALNQQATRLANQMVSAMKKALKIKSPSQITDEIGVNVGLGLANGLTSQIDDVAANGARLAEAAIQLPPANDRLAAEWGRMHAAATAPTAGTGSGAQPGTTIGTLNVELRLDDLKQMKTVEDFLNIIDRARVRGRTTARSGSVTTG